MGKFKSNSKWLKTYYKYKSQRTLLIPKQSAEYAGSNRKKINKHHLQVYLE